MWTSQGGSGIFCNLTPITVWQKRPLRILWCTPPLSNTVKSNSQKMISLSWPLPRWHLPIVHNYCLIDLQSSVHAACILGWASEKWCGAEDKYCFYAVLCFVLFFSFFQPYRFCQGQLISVKFCSDIPAMHKHHIILINKRRHWEEGHHIGIQSWQWKFASLFIVTNIYTKMKN